MNEYGKVMQRWIALVGISFLAFTAFLDITIVNTALPFIQKAFDSSVLELQWVTNIFTMLLAMMMVAAGRFADLYGRKKVFYLGVAIFGIGALGAGLSQTIGSLILFRGVQGLGGSVLFVAAATLITEALPKHEHAKGISIYTCITGLGLAIGPAVGGFLVGLLGWRWVFLVNIPLIVVGFVCCALCLKLPPHLKPNTKIDMKGLSLLIVGLGSLIYGIISTADQGPFFWAFLLIGISFLTLFFLSERKSKMPLVDFSIFRKKLIVLASLTVASAAVSTIIYLFFDPLYLRNLRQLSAYKVGFMIAAIPVCQVVISIFFRTFLKWWGIHRFLMIAILASPIAVILHRFLEVSTPLGLIFIPFAIMGINWGMTNNGVIAAINEAIEPARVGEAIGSVLTIWNILGSIFLAISSAIFHLKDKTSFIAGFHAMTDLNIIFALLTFIAAYVVNRKWCAKSR